MSPITHALTGWIISNKLKRKRERAFVTSCSIISDIDSLTLDQKSFQFLKNGITQ